MSRFNYNPQGVKRYLFEARRCNEEDISGLEGKVDEKTSSSKEPSPNTPFYLKYR